MEKTEKQVGAALEVRSYTIRRGVTLLNECDANGVQVQAMAADHMERDADGKTVWAVDAIFFPDLLPGLRFEENVVPVDVTISLDPRIGAREAWIFGKSPRLRNLTMFKPYYVKEDDDSCTYRTKQGAMYLDEWRRSDFFPQIEGRAVFKVWMSVKRATPITIPADNNRNQIIVKIDEPDEREPKSHPRHRASRRK